jgi:hypothetical protein
MNRPDWDSRFNIVSSRDNPKVHEFFREYFDKPHRRKQDRISLPSNPSKFYPNLSSTLDNFSHRIPKLKKLGVKNKKKLEKGWKANFQMKNSKDNHRFYSTYREYFDAPKTFDHNSSVVSTIPATAHGFKRTPLRLRSSEDHHSWSEIYSPVSENNLVKYRALRSYFDSPGLNVPIS